MDQTYAGLQQAGESVRPCKARQNAPPSQTVGRCGLLKPPVFTPVGSDSFSLGVAGLFES